MGALVDGEVVGGAEEALGGEPPQEHIPHTRGFPFGARRPFISSDRFRVNANKQRLDVWLIYRCGCCEQPWNLAVHERARPSEPRTSSAPCRRKVCDSGG